MQDEMFAKERDKNEPVRSAKGRRKADPGFAIRMLDQAARAWRPTGTGLAVIFTLMLGWHVVNGRHGLSVWQQKRIEDRQLKQEIQTLQLENEHLRARVQKLKSDPDAIEHEAREKMHYARPDEVIYALPPDHGGVQATK